MNDVFKQNLILDIDSASSIDELKYVLIRLVGSIKTENALKKEFVENLSSVFKSISKDSE